MKHLSWLLLAGLLAGAGCSSSTDNSAAVNTTETEDASATEDAEEEKTTEVAIDGSGEVAIDVELDIGEDGSVVATEVEKSEKSGDEESKKVTISMTANGFEPSMVTVTAGTTVTFVNNDSAEHWPASAFHPTHLELPGFDALKGIAPEGSYSFTFSEAGTWKFHDHLTPTLFGSVVVE